VLFWLVRRRLPGWRERKRCLRHDLPHDRSLFQKLSHNMATRVVVLWHRLSSCRRGHEVWRNHEYTGYCFRRQPRNMLQCGRAEAARGGEVDITGMVRKGQEQPGIQALSVQASTSPRTARSLWQGCLRWPVPRGSPQLVNHRLVRPTRSAKASCISRRYPQRARRRIEFATPAKRGIRDRTSQRDRRE
jgi:hypothetical protein